jgi:hypothetical protein
MHPNDECAPQVRPAFDRADEFHRQVATPAV